jgi:regulator of sigma E protease
MFLLLSLMFFTTFNDLKDLGLFNWLNSFKW